MRFEITPTFRSDFSKLKREHKELFRATVTSKFNDACDAFAADPTSAWPASLRVKPMKYVNGVYEMTWSFNSPDGRATFELRRDDHGMYCLWRRVGDHGIYTKP